MHKSFAAVLLFSITALAEPPVDRAVTRCTMIPVPLNFRYTDWKIERCAEDIETNEIWQVDRSDSVSGNLNGEAVRSTTGKGVVVYVLDVGVMRSHDEFRRDNGESAVIGGYDAFEGSGAGRSRCSNMAVEPCYLFPGDQVIHGHGTSVGSVVAGRNVGIAPDAKLYAERIFPTFDEESEFRMWHVALDDIIRHAHDPATPQFETAIVTNSVPVQALVPSDDPQYAALIEKVRRMTVGVDASGNEDPDGKKFLFTVAAGNVMPGRDWCATFPAILGQDVEGVVTVGALTRDNVRWSGSCAGASVEVMAPGDQPLMASISAVDNYRRGAGVSGTSFAAPYVAGIAARLLEIDPTRTPAELEALLEQSPSRASDSGLPVPVLTIGEEMQNQR